MEKMAISITEIKPMVDELTETKDFLNECLKKTKSMVNRSDYQFLKRKTSSMVYQINLAIIKLLKYRLVKVEPVEWESMRAFYQEVIQQRDELRKKISKK